jgi:hypothetical protein
MSSGTLDQLGNSPVGTPLLLLCHVCPTPSLVLYSSFSIFRDSPYNQSMCYCSHQSPFAFFFACQPITVYTQTHDFRSLTVRAHASSTAKFIRLVNRPRSKKSSTNGLPAACVPIMEIDFYIDSLSRASRHTKRPCLLNPLVILFSRRHAFTTRSASLAPGDQLVAGQCNCLLLLYASDSQKNMLPACPSQNHSWFVYWCFHSYSFAMIS